MYGLVLFLVCTYALLTAAAIPAVSLASSYLRFYTPNSGIKVPANQFFLVVGNSLPSNTTRTHCTVMLQTNHHGYMPVRPLGPQGPNAYTRWEAKTSEPVKLGVNEVEAQFQCFAPNTNIPNFTKHLVHNFTGIAITPLTSNTNMSTFNSNNTSNNTTLPPPLLR